MSFMTLSVATALAVVHADRERTDTDSEGAEGPHTRHNRVLYLHLKLSCPFPHSRVSTIISRFGFDEFLDVYLQF